MKTLKIQGFEDIILDEVADLQQGLSRKEGEPVAVSYKLNVAIINILWNLACGRKLHAQQQEFQVGLVLEAECNFYQSVSSEILLS